MKKKLSKVIITLTISVFLLSLVPAISFATNSSQNEEATASYKRAKENFLNAISDYKKAKENFRAAKTAFIANKSEKNREEALEKAKNALTKACDSMINYLEALKNKASGIKKIAQEERTEIISQLDTEISWVNSKKDEINNITNREDLVSFVKEIRAHWKDIRVMAKRVTGQILNAKITYLIDRFQKTANKVSQKITELKSQGKDTTEIEKLLEDFNSKIALAKEKHDAAAAKFIEIKTFADANKFFKEGMSLVREARKYLKNAHVDLVKMVKEIKKIENK